MTVEPGRMARRLLCGALMAGVCAVDAVTPLGVNVPIVYLVPLLIAFLSESVPTRTVLTIAASALTVLGLLWQSKWNDSWMHGLLNRSFDLSVFGVALVLSIRDARKTRQLRNLRRALDDSSIVSITDALGTIRHVNDGFCALSGYAREELVGADHRIVASGAPSGAFTRELWAAIGSGRVWHGEVQNRTKDGALYWVDTTVVPLLDGRGEPYEYLAIQHDISAQKHAEACLRSQMALEKIGEMAAIVAHEVQNPVAGVRAALQLLERKVSLTGDERCLVRQMIERLDVLGVHVTALVHFATWRPAQMQALALRPLLHEAAMAVRSAGGVSAVSCDIVGPDARVIGDPAMLCEVFSRLLMNAAEAQHGAGTVAVTVTECGHSVSVSISDHGPGIPAALRARVFEPLFTTKLHAMGIGLALAKQLVELHAGEIQIADKSAPGTTIRVDLPRALAGDRLNMAAPPRVSA
jgi:two-component system CheB/CheR fusion protein